MNAVISQHFVNSAFFSEKKNVGEQSNSSSPSFLPVTPFLLLKRSLVVLARTC